jgi:NAD(P)H dehydrogenase (quinone)
MIVVTGVTGKLGRVVIDDLLGRVPAGELAAVARDPLRAADLAERGVDVRPGDYQDPASLRAAFAGADVLLFVSSPDVTPGVRVRQHGNVVDAARAAGVGRVAYTSAIGADNATGFLADHTVTEGLLRDSGVPHTLLRNTFYAEVLINPGLRDAVAAGELRGADGGVPVNFATIRDLGLAASAALTGDGHEGAVYELRGPLWTVRELAATVSEVAGSPVAYRAVPVAELGPAGFVHELIAAGLFAEPSPDLEKLLGRPATTLSQAVADALRAP